MVATSNLIAVSLFVVVFMAAMQSSTTMSSSDPGFMWSRNDMNKVMDVWNALNAYSSKCNGRIRDCFPEEEMLMDSEINRRILSQSRRRRRSYISYDVLISDNVPCSKRGRSYYACGDSGPANPYKRPCSKITRCERDNS